MIETQLLKISTQKKKKKKTNRIAKVQIKN